MDLLNLPPWLDNAIGIVTTVPFIYWYLRKWLLLRQLTHNAQSAGAQVLRKMGNHVLYHYTDSHGRSHRQRVALEKPIADKLRPGDTLTVLYATHKTGFSCPADEVDATLRKTKRALFSFIGVNALCFILPLLV